jgi:hypothetical protein
MHCVSPLLEVNIGCGGQGGRSYGPPRTTVQEYREQLEALGIKLWQGTMD